MTFIKNIWYVAAWSSDVVSGSPHGCVIAEVPVVLYRKNDGTIAALEDRCSHRCAPLSKGRIEGDSLRCWYHGLLFGEDGSCLEMPGKKGLPKGFDIHNFPVVEKEGWVWVWLGDLDLANTSLIPTCDLNAGGIDFRSGVLEYAANYQLINDNLCDLSHVAYVHEKTLARDATDWVEREATYSKVENGIGVQRWIVGSRPLPIPGLPERIDIYSSYEFYLPGIMSLLISYYPLGTAEKSGFEKPDIDHIFAVRTTHAMTPSNEKTTNYHFGVSLPATDNPTAEVMDMALDMVTVAFKEDKDTIEAQQASLDLFPEVVLSNTIHDKALVRIRRLITDRIKEEQGIS